MQAAVGTSLDESPHRRVVMSQPMLAGQRLQREAVLGAHPPEQLQSELLDSLRDRLLDQVCRHLNTCAKRSRAWL